jgi:hypothetical protein
MTEWLSRARAVAIAIVAAHALSGCSTPPHTWVVHSSSTPRAATLDKTALERERVATLEPSTPGALQGFAIALSHSLAEALSEASPPVRNIPAHEVVSRLNEQGLAAEYGDLVAGFARGGVLDRDRLQRIGDAVGTRYILQPGLGEFTQVVADKLEAVGFKLVKTRLSTMRLWLQLWDARTGEILWQSSGQVTVAAQLLTRESAAVSFEDIAQRLWLRMIQDDLLGGSTRSRSFVE